MDKDKKREYDRTRYQAKKSEWKERRAKWALANPDKVEKSRRKWEEAHPGWRTENLRKWRSNNPEKDQDAIHRRRARKKGCTVGSADIRQVIEVSGGLCALCRAYVPEDMRHIDHIVPLQKGGPHSHENLQLLCYRCNGKKGSKLPEEVTAETWTRKTPEGQPFLLNPNWR